MIIISLDNTFTFPDNTYYNIKLTILSLSQTILMIIGALVLSVLAFTHEEIGGYEQLVGYQDGDDDDGQVDDE